jgi:tetratricopeptide (TPR) repeat protein
VLLITLDWRPMSHGIEAPRDMLAFTTLALDAAGSVDEATLTAECYREAAAKLAGCGDLETAGTYFTSALSMFEEAGDLAGQANTLRNLAVNVTNDPGERVRQAEHAVRLARRCGVPLVLCTALGTYGYILVLAGQGTAALPALSEALALAQDDPGDESLAARILAEIAKSHAVAGDIPRAIAIGERALAALRTMNDKTTEIDLLAGHGDVLLASGQPERAIEAWERYLALSSNIGIVDGLAAEKGLTATEALAQVRKKLASVRRNDN